MAAKRLAFVHQGETVYEWEQSLDEVRVFVRPPAGLRARDIECSIKSTRVRLGVKGNKPFLDGELFSVAEEAASTWSLDGDGVLEISLAKARKAETWESVFKGHGALSPLDRDEVHKKLTLERFQEEHAGFDFSGAEFSGAPPDPREFMGGVKYP